MLTLEVKARSTRGKRNSPRRFRQRSQRSRRPKSNWKLSSPWTRPSKKGSLSSQFSKLKEELWCRIHLRLPRCSKKSPSWSRKYRL